MKAGLQLYSIKNETEKDMIGSLKRVSEIGYEGVEFAGYRDVTAKDMKRALTDFGLRSIGTHLGMDRIQNNLDEEIEYNLEIGTKYIILPYAKFETISDVQSVSELLNKAAEKAKGTGLKVGYHNHAQEFDKIEDEYILDLLIKNTSEDVIFELDVYWTAVGNVDPIEYIKTRNKIEMIHVKELSDYETKGNTDVGSGVLDFPSIIEAAKQGGAKEFVVEQEKTEGCIWESITNGINYLKNL